MPMYIYIREDTLEQKELFFHMNDDKPERVIENGVTWKRDWGAIRVQGVVDGKMNAFSSQAFIDKTNKMKGGTIGQLWDMSKELSEKRERVCGQDPLKRKALDDYSKKRLGRKHQQDTT